LAEWEAFAWSSRVTLERLPAPTAVAQWSAALEITVQAAAPGSAEAAIAAGAEDCWGRLTLLHQPQGDPDWEGDFRLVALIQAPIDEPSAIDPYRPMADWNRLLEQLDERQADFRAPSGTVTASLNQSFGGLADRPPRQEVELRVSWTPALADGGGLTAHLAAWQDTVILMAGRPVEALSPDELAAIVPGPGAAPRPGWSPPAGGLSL
jgi:hypothetical protein